MPALQRGADQHQHNAEQITRGQPSGQGIEQRAPQQLTRDDQQGTGQGTDPAYGPAADGDEERPQHAAEQQPGIEPGEPLPGRALEDEQGAEQPKAEQVVGKGGRHGAPGAGEAAIEGARQAHRHAVKQSQQDQCGHGVSHNAAR